MRKIISFIILLVSVILLSACGLVAWEPGNLLSEVARESIPVEGGTLSVEESELKGFSIEIPKDAYQETVDFIISTEEFNPEVPQESFNAITPLIVIDNGHVISDEGLVVTIPINIDSETEFAMAFYYDSDADNYEAIPTLSYNDNEIEILTTHFSKIVVSSIPFDELEKDIINNPELYNTGFIPGIDDIPVSNNGTELEVLGHCAGQTAFMAYYYMEHKLKNNEENLYTRFDNNTPNFKTDDIAIEQLASAIQNSINWKSSVYKKLELSLKESDINRFYSFAYAIKITKSPQYMEIRDFKSNPVSGNAHAILAFKITYEDNQFKIYVADPNFPGEDRHISFSKETGFGVYSSGINASEATTNGKGYSDFLFAGTYAIVEKVQIELLYNKMISNTLEDEMFSSYAYLYQVAKDGEYIYVPLVDGSVISPIAYGGEPARMKVLIAVANPDFNAIFFRDQKIVYPYPVVTEKIEGSDYIKYSMLLAKGETKLGISTSRLVESIYGDSSSKEWGKSRYYNIKVNYNPFDYSTYVGQLEGDYKEVSRGKDADNWPTDRVITFNSDGTGSISWDSESGEPNDTYWIIKENNKKQVIEMAIKDTQFYEDYEYNPETNQITINPNTEKSITYEKVKASYTYSLEYQTSNIGSGRDRIRVYSACPDTLLLDNQFRLDVNPMFGTLILLYYRILSDDPNYKFTFTNSANLGQDGYEGTSIYDWFANYNRDFQGWIPSSGTSMVYVNIQHLINEEWVVVKTIEVEITVDLYLE